jgi:hypothetical protein
MKTAVLKLVLAGTLLGAAPVTALAQYQIDWYTIAGGGGTSTGGVYSVSGTIGQADAGTMSGGNFTLQGGFWGMVGVVQIPNAPFLSLTRAGSSVILSWPSGTTTFTLQSETSLRTGSWSAVPLTPLVSGGTNYVTNTIAPGNTFYRLNAPQ